MTLAQIFGSAPLDQTRFTSRERDRIFANLLRGATDTPGGREAANALIARSNLNRVNFSKIFSREIRSVSLAKKRMRRAVFSELLLNEVSFEKADITGAKFINIKARRINLQGAKASFTVWHGGVATKSSFKNAILIGADFRGCDLSGCDFTGAVLISALVSDCSFVGANLKNANFINSDLSRSKLLDAKMDGTRFMYANLEACLLNEHMPPANFRGAVLPHGRRDPYPNEYPSRPLTTSEQFSLAASWTSPWLLSLCY